MLHVVRLAWAGAAVSGGLALSAGAALAHHPIGGATPDNFLHGLLSGLGHPLIGVDHLAFVIAVGIACALSGTRLLVPALFILATIGGCLLRTASGVTLPFGEFVIAASVLVAGAMVMSGQRINQRVYGLVFVVAGLFHGGAYAEAIVGAEATPLGAYLAGFAIVQFAVIAAAYLMTKMAERASAGMAVQPRLAGAMVAGVGLTFLVEHAEKIVFPGM